MRRGHHAVFVTLALGSMHPHPTSVYLQVVELLPSTIRDMRWAPDIAPRAGFYVAATISGVAAAYVLTEFFFSHRRRGSRNRRLSLPHSHGVSDGEAKHDTKTGPDSLDLNVRYDTGSSSASPVHASLESHSSDHTVGLPMSDSEYPLAALDGGTRPSPSVGASAATSPTSALPQLRIPSPSLASSLADGSAQPTNMSPSDSISPTSPEATFFSPLSSPGGWSVLGSEDGNTSDDGGDDPQLKSSATQEVGNASFASILSPSAHTSARRSNLGAGWPVTGVNEALRILGAVNVPQRVLRKHARRVDVIVPRALGRCHEAFRKAKARVKGKPRIYGKEGHIRGKRFMLRGIDVAYRRGHCQQAFWPASDEMSGNIAQLSLNVSRPPTIRDMRRPSDVAIRAGLYIAATISGVAAAYVVTELILNLRDSWNLGLSLPHSHDDGDSDGEANHDMKAEPDTSDLSARHDAGSSPTSFGHALVESRSSDHMVDLPTSVSEYPLPAHDEDTRPSPSLILNLRDSWNLGLSLPHSHDDGDSDGEANHDMKAEPDTSDLSARHDAGSSPTSFGHALVESRSSDHMVDLPTSVSEYPLPAHDEDTRPSPSYPSAASHTLAFAGVFNGRLACPINKKHEPLRLDLSHEL
ncbi:hypothetical protein PAXINDRAFT_157230 [Paxillus involutus ATCC 200175]|uniref:Uncharacterized protein n=1 Tax=Paxillus involutus ATCC 200175 TaxID=664439 RepID=A0A0C9TMD5_PAXIN|nr:hypothetical protein PAXINDRAFT_157230 [Paxillus involutus ATCC 200175]